MKVSIIIVNYKVKQELYSCIQSIVSRTKNIRYEIIVVDNYEKSNIKKELLLKFSQVIYIKNKENVGYGEAINRGVKRAKGEYIFVINPDSKVLVGTINNLYSFITKQKNVGIVAPLLRFPDKSIYPLQGSATLTPFRGLVALSFLNVLFPENGISKNYWLLDWDKKETKEVDVVPGTAFMIRKKLFKEVGGFDKQFFLYFEENDICKRIKEKGYNLYILPSASILHKGGESTKQRWDSHLQFIKSRFYYFKKHYGILAAVFVHIVLSINKIFAISFASIFLLYLLIRVTITK
jgi:N-acetylglucosaminyl-diphospho-decaprenol L-rhamnosyltransferase